MNKDYLNELSKVRLVKRCYLNEVSKGRQANKLIGLN